MGNHFQDDLVGVIQGLPHIATVWILIHGIPGPVRVLGARIDLFNRGPHFRPLHFIHWPYLELSLHDSRARRAPRPRQPEQHMDLDGLGPLLNFCAHTRNSCSNWRGIRLNLHRYGNAQKRVFIGLIHSVVLAHLQVIFAE
jgi:hypothetical protein